MLPDSVHIGRQSRPLKGFSHFHNRGRNKRIFKTSGSELQICPIVQGNISALMAQERRLRIKCMRNLLCRKSLILCGFPAFFSYTVKQIFIFQVHSDILFYVPSSDYTSLRQPHEAMYPGLPYHDSGELLQFHS